jgi:2-C-methyl-D-erythritol 4-phosphate cytidylyltransferase
MVMPGDNVAIEAAADHADRHGERGCVLRFAKADARWVPASSVILSNNLKEPIRESHRNAGMQCVQTPQLYNYQKQADHTGQAGVQQVLSVLSETYAAQGNQIAIAIRRCVPA